MCVSSCTREQQSHLPGHHRGFLQARRTASQSVPFFILRCLLPTCMARGPALELILHLGRAQGMCRAVTLHWIMGETSCL